MTFFEILIRLVLAIIISGIIGFDREFKNRPAGIRTHILVCLGAVVIAMIQQQITSDALSLAQDNPSLSGIVRVDQARLIAQVVSGIGFLGAGTIIVTKHSILGLTTAASLWATAGLGIAIGMGYYQIAGISAVAVLLVLSVLNKVLHFNTLKKVEIKYRHRIETKEFITDYFTDQKVKVKDVNFDVEIFGDQSIYTNIYTIELPRKLSYSELIEAISLNKNVMKIRMISI